MSTSEFLTMPVETMKPVTSSFMKRRMTQENSETAATWLAERVFKLGRQDGDDAAPRVSIVINAAMSPADYARMIEVTQV